ncbi:hypothetical protein LINGRAHAP2_LOCUS32123 [Linum grandiflorum]
MANYPYRLHLISTTEVEADPNPLSTFPREVYAFTKFEDLVYRSNNNELLSGDLYATNTDGTRVSVEPVMERSQAIMSMYKIQLRVRDDTGTASFALLGNVAESPLQVTVDDLCKYASCNGYRSRWFNVAIGWA